MNEIIILGSGPSVGVPVIGCDCLVCASSDPKNSRTKSSILIKYNGKNILVDFGADIRFQLIREKVKDIEGAILTHDHADHLNGIDDLKMFSFYKKRPLNIYSDPQTLEDITNRFPYMFKSDLLHSNDVFGTTRLLSKPVIVNEENLIEDIPITLFKQNHGKIDSLGLKIGKTVYSGDMLDLYEENNRLLENLDLWILSCIGEKSSYSHTGLDKILFWQEVYKPKEIILVNITHNFDYYELSKRLPKGIKVGFDGMRVNI